MPAAIAALFVCQLLGELAVRLVDLPVPGPVVGLVLLLIWIARGVMVPREMSGTAHGLLAHLSLLFVPAGSGIILHLDTISRDGLAIGAALVGSTLLALAATAFTFHLIARRMGIEGSHGEEGSER